MENEYRKDMVLLGLE